MLTTCFALLFLAGNLAAQVAPGPRQQVLNRGRAIAAAEPQRLDPILANPHAERRLAKAQCAAIELRLARALGRQPN